MRSVEALQVGLACDHFTRFGHRVAQLLQSKHIQLDGSPLLAFLSSEYAWARGAFLGRPGAATTLASEKPELHTRAARRRREPMAARAEASSSAEI